MRSQNAKNTPKVEPPKDEPYINGRDFIGPKHEWANEPDEVRDKIEQKIRTLLNIFGNEILAYGRTGESTNPKLFTDTTQALLEIFKLQQEALLSKVEAELPEQAWYVHGVSTKDKLRNQFNAGYNTATDRVKTTINKLRLEL